MTNLLRLAAEKEDIRRFFETTEIPIESNVKS